MFEVNQKQLSQWMDGVESVLQDIIKPTITDRIAVADNSAPLVQVSRLR